MATNIITGSSNAGKFIEKADDNVLTIIGALDAVNNSDTIKQIKGIDAMKPFVRNIFGINGTTEVIKNFQVWGVEDGDNSDSPTTNETYDSWLSASHAA